MKYALNLAEDGRILSATFAKYNPNGVLVDTLPEGNVADYRYENGEFIFDPIVVTVTAEQQIAELKAQLEVTDYKAIKYAEGWISEEEYAPIKAERQALRDKINELEGGIE